MKSDLYSIENGNSVGSVDLPDAVFKNQVNDHVIYEAIKTELSNQRQGTVSTQERGEVTATGSKPYRQKGTGRARAGTRRSPIWVGGGTTFGPKPRSFKKRLPKKIRLRAMVSLLSKKTADGKVKVVDSFAFTSGKTKEIAGMLSQVCSKDRVVLILNGADMDFLKIVKRAASNISWVKVYSSTQLTYKDLFYAKEVLVMKDALKDIGEHYTIIKKGDK